MKVNLKIWRQKDSKSKGKFIKYKLDDVSPEMSFLDMLDFLNEQLIKKGEDPVSFDHDCREGICGACGLYINGRPHGPLKKSTTCELYMREFKDGSTIVVEPWRSKAFPVIKDLMVNRSALDEIIRSGGYISVGAGAAPEANSIPVGKEVSDKAFDLAVCIGCGACVAACKNSSAMLFVAAKVSQMAILPHGKPEATKRVKRMVNKSDELGFGGCSNTYSCEFDCPKGISVEAIARMNREFFKSTVCKSKS